MEVSLTISFDISMMCHKGKKNQHFEKHTQVYLNEAHEKVKITKIYAVLRVKKKD